jgi:hypothetical protein
LNHILLFYNIHITTAFLLKLLFFIFLQIILDFINGEYHLQELLMQGLIW